MKIDRLLSIIIYLLNRDLVSARELAEHFSVSVRTIQRDMDTLGSAGIPIQSTQGSQGGFGIISEYKFDRQLVDTNDLFYILTALESIGATYKNNRITTTLEKVKTLVHDYQQQEFLKRKDKFSIDFSGLGLGTDKEMFPLLENAIEESKLVSFRYTNYKYETKERIVEPMTIVFKWYAWYLFGYCKLRNDYRIFRISRMSDLTLLEERFQRREKQFSDTDKEHIDNQENFIPVMLKFMPDVKAVVHDHFSNQKRTIDENGYMIVNVNYPENEWLYGVILSYGDKVEVLDPPHLRQIIAERAEKIFKKYKN